uniref:Uncharacterized protein n=1 Tax=Ditylenchus dipsaci TaxID=166011 RepID=A0A915EDN6_9BILA
MEGEGTKCGRTLDMMFLDEADQILLDEIASLAKVSKVFLALSSYSIQWLVFWCQLEYALSRIKEGSMKKARLFRPVTLDNGLHQFLQLKHLLALSTEGLNTTFMWYLTYLKRYGSNLYGITGTVAKATPDNFNGLLQSEYS